MDRRDFGLMWLLTATAGVLTSLPGCGGESTETGTVVKTPPEDRESMEASAAAYRSMQKGPASAAGKK